MTHTLHLDCETFSTVDLTDVGTPVYAEHPTTDVHCVSHAVDDEAPKTWRRAAPDEVPWQISTAIREGWTLCAHNAAFERIIWNYILGPRYGWPIPKLEQWRCTMVQALAMALPASLKNATRAVGIDDGGKLDEGRALMLQMCKPRRPKKGEDPFRTCWHHEDPDGPDRLERLYRVCEKDVIDERELDKRTLRLSPAELRLWHLDQTINDRGVHVDRALVEAALNIVNESEDALNDELLAITDGEVGALTKVTQIARWCRLQGFPTASLSKDAVEDLLARKDLTPVVRRVLEIRLEGAKATVKKLNALDRGKSNDGRARHLLQFHAAGTGRWAGRRFQPQNIKRPDLDDVDGAIEAVATASAEIVRMLYGEPLAVVADIIRGCVCAAPRNTLYAADFSNIEGRLQAWLAGEDWKLEAFRRQDAGTGPEIYKITAAKILTQMTGQRRTPESITKKERQSYGKVPELALGYQGGVGAFQKMAQNYGVQIRDEQADEIKVSWRADHPAIVQCWYDLQNAAMRAIERKGAIVRPCDVNYQIGGIGGTDKIAFRCAGSFLFMRLPSGRCICYPYPGIKPKLMPWRDENGNPVWKDSIRYMGVDSYTHKWCEQWAHGGLLFNNAVQGIAADVMREAIVRVEAAGYPVVLTVHDEGVSETPEDFGSLEEYARLISTLPKWCPDLPLTVKGWSGLRYRKD